VSRAIDKFRSLRSSVVTKHLQSRTGYESYWPRVVDAITNFNKVVDSIDLDRENTQLTLDEAKTISMARPDWRLDAQKWLFNGFAVGEINAYRLVRIKFTHTTDIKEYQEIVQSAVDSIAPERWSHRGLKITNPDRLGARLCADLLESIDYLEQLFKQRKADKLLTLGLAEVRIVLDASEAHGAGDTGAYYQPSQRLIVMGAEVMRTLESHWMQKWVRATFVHEFGHFLHMTYIPEEAKRFWDQGWSEVAQREQERDVPLRITFEDRGKYFDTWKHHGFDVGKTVKSLKDPIDKLKFGIWLRNPPMGGEPLITPAQFRLTKFGKDVVSLFQDPKTYMKVNYDLDPHDADYKDRLGRKVKQRYDIIGLLWEGSMSVSKEVQAEFLKQNPQLQKAVDEAKESLGIVSEYGKTDKYEDFAETFRAWMIKPSALTDQAKYRMQRTLSLSGLYGKPIMRLSVKKTGQVVFHL
jgi:hypothetical protein